jgi:hypothetical protein
MWNESSWAVFQFGLVWGVLAFIIASIVIATLAVERKRSGLGWFLFSLFCSPLIAGVCLCAAPLPMREHTPAFTAIPVSDVAATPTKTARIEPTVTEAERAQLYEQWLKKGK